MDKKVFEKRLAHLFQEHHQLIERKNRKLEEGSGVCDRYEYPVLTAAHTPLFWRYDLNYQTNPHLMERMGVNSVFNAGAIEWEGKFCLAARVEGADRKSFFAIAESPTGIDNFKFWDYPILLPETDNPDTNVYDMRLVRHADGWIYGIFCTERPDPHAPKGSISAAIAQCGLVRTKDLRSWQRLADIKTPSSQQRNAVLHPEFVNSRYAFYTRPQEQFMESAGDGIGFGLVDDIEHPVIEKEIILDSRQYHTITEIKNGLGPAPIKTDQGWLHLAHGVRNTAAGMRYVLYAFLAQLDEPQKVIHKPAGYLLAPEGPERIGDVSNVLFGNGWIPRDNGDLFIYYASSDTRLHVATTTVEKLLDYVINTPEDPLRTHACVQQRIQLIEKNMPILKSLKTKT